MAKRIKTTIKQDSLRISMKVNRSDAADKLSKILDVLHSTSDEPITVRTDDPRWLKAVKRDDANDE